MKAVLIIAGIFVALIFAIFLLQLALNLFNEYVKKRYEKAKMRDLEQNKNGRDCKSCEEIDTCPAYGMATCSRYRNRPLKVYRMNDCDWWCDYSLEEAEEHFKEYFGKDALLDDVLELTNTELETLTYCAGKLWLFDGCAEKIEYSFKQELRYRKKPGFFATTEN